MPNWNLREHVRNIGKLLRDNVVTCTFSTSEGGVCGKIKFHLIGVEQAVATRTCGLCVKTT